MITFISTFPPMICGIGTYTKYLSDHIHPDLWRVVSFRLNEFSSSGEVLSPDVRKHVDYYFSFPNPSLPPYCEHGLLWFQHAFGMWGNSGDHFLTLLEEGRRRANSIVVSCHTIHFESKDTSFGMHPKEVELLKQTLPLVDALTVFTDGARRAVVRAFPEHREKIVVLRHGVHMYPNVPMREARKEFLSYLINRAQIPFFQKRELMAIEKDFYSKQTILLGNYGFITSDKDPLQLYKLGRQVQEELPQHRVITIFAGIIQRRKDKRINSYTAILEKLKSIHDGRRNFFFELYIPEDIFPLAYGALDFAVFWCNNATQSGRMAHAQGTSTMVVGRDWEGVGETLKLAGLPAAKNFGDLAKSIADIAAEPGLRQEIHRQGQKYTQKFSFYSQAQKHLMLAEAVKNQEKLPPLDRSVEDDFYMGKISNWDSRGFEESRKIYRFHS